jgi:transcriptional regulator with XRE-family HTH domain
MSLRLLLTTSREQQGLSQEELAEQLNVAQGTVSAWENGTQIPTRKHRGPLAKVLHLDPKDVEAEAAAAAVVPRPSRILSLAGYLRQQQAYLESLGSARNKVKVCFIGPEHLPVLDSASVEETWTSNLLAGTNYAILWFLCLLDPGAIQRVTHRFRAIGTAVSQRRSKSAGRIIHYGLRLLDRPDDSVYDSNLAGFNACKSAGLPANEWILQQQLNPDLKKQLLQHYVPLGTLVAYHHEVVGFSRLASISLRATRTSPDGDEQAAFHFLGAAECEALFNVLTRFFQAIDSFRPMRKK